MHIVDVTMFYAADAGGVKTYLATKSDWLTRHTRIRHTVVGPGAGQHDSPGHFIGVESFPFPWANGFRMPSSVEQGVQVLRGLKPDLIEAGDCFTLAWAALRHKRTHDVPVVAYYHSDLLQIVGSRLGAFPRWVVSKYVADIYRRFDLVFAPSRLVADRLRELGVPNVRHQPLGVDTAVFHPQRRDPVLRARLGLPPDARVLVYAGRFTREKKLPVLFEAVRRLGDPYYLVMIGNGRELPSSPRVIHIPFQRDPRTLAAVLASCDMLVHPGDQETFGLIALEAMACGIPVLGVAAGGIAELVDESTGLLVRPGSSAALAEGIEAMYGRDLAALGQQGRQRAAALYDWSNIVPGLVRQYADLVAAGHRAELEAGLAFATK